MKTILLIEDEPDLIDILDIVFSGEGFEVFRMQTAEDALQFCQVNRPDVILSDIKMGHMDGLTMLEEMRKLEHLQQVPFIVVSAAGDTSLIAQAKSLGATAYFTKPFDLEELVQVVTGILATNDKKPVPQILWPDT